MYSNPNIPRRLVWISAISLMVLFAGAASVPVVYAQATATILGTVTDPSGAAIGGAMVQAKNTGTSLTQTTVSDEQGRYRFPPALGNTA